MNSFGASDIRAQLNRGQATPFIGVYDVFSASIAYRSYSTLFISGFGFGASHYGLPDAGFITWTDLLHYVTRVRRVAPDAKLLVDIDDGFGDESVACHVAMSLEAIGAFGVVLEDQKRPRKCGHLGGKVLLPLDEYLHKLKAVLASRENLFVVARTDASDPEEVLERVRAYAEAGADAVLADGLTDLSMLRRMYEQVDCPVAFNQIAGGKSPAATLSELQNYGASLIIYSTPCLFTVQRAMEQCLSDLKEQDGSLEAVANASVDLTACNGLLQENLQASHARLVR